MHSALRLLCPGFILCAVLARAVEPVAPPPLELPKVIVTDERPLPPPESWRYAQVPGLEILSGVPDGETQKMLRDFQLFNGAVSVVWPGIKAHRPLPLALILCGPGKFEAFKPAADSKLNAGRASLLLKGPDQAAIVLNSSAKIIDLAPTEVETTAPEIPVSDDPADAAPETGNQRGTVEVDYYRQLYREYVRYLLSFNQPRLPVWLQEGLTQLLMGMKVDSKFIEFAKLADPNLAELPGGGGARDNDFNKSLGKRGLIPLAEFFAVTYESPEATNPLTSKWAKQAQGLLHLWLYGEGKRYNKGFAQFAARATRGEPVTEPMFRECFGMGYDEMLTAFRIYIGNTAYQHQEFEAKNGGGLPEPAPLVLRDATQAEVGRIKGEALVLADHVELARDEMLAPYARGVSDGPLLASMGILEKTRGETARARKFLEAAALQQVVRPRAYLELATLRYAQATAAAGNNLLSADQTKTIIQPLLLARQQPPPLPEVYELMADVWLHSSAAPGKADLGAINQGVLLFQRRPVLLLHAAELNGKYGNPAEALTMANYGIKLSQTPEARAAFEEVKAALPPVPVK